MRTDFMPSPYQEAIFDFVRRGTGHAMIEAVAGSGKSTTLLKALELLPPKTSVAFLAFNREIARHLRALAPKHVKVCTLHSLGYEAVRQAFGETALLDDRKTARIVSALMPNGLRGLEQSHIGEIRHEMGRLVSLAKTTQVDPGDRDVVTELVDRHGISLGINREQVSSLLVEALDLSVRQPDVIDYDDMIYLPVRLGLRMPQFDVLLVDEAQDLNVAQIELVLRSLRPGGRVTLAPLAWQVRVAVFDCRQSIYGLRGAAADAIPNLIDRLGATTLPLSIFYRCPRRHLILVVWSANSATNRLSG